MSHVRPFTDLLRLVTGPAVWFAHFTVVYGAEALICTPPIGSPRAMVWTGLAATIAALAALIAFAMMLWRERIPEEAPHEHTGAAFLRAAPLLLAVLAMLAVIWTSLPIAALSACTAAAG
jgi:hypothetical protein